MTRQNLSPQYGFKSLKLFNHYSDINLKRFLGRAINGELGLIKAFITVSCVYCLGSLSSIFHMGALAYDLKIEVKVGLYMPPYDLGSIVVESYSSALMSKIREPYCNSKRSTVQLYWDVVVQKNISLSLVSSVVL